MPDTHPLTVVHIPHASQVIPTDVRATFVVSPQTLAAELLRMTDHFTDELFRLPSALATSVEFSVSRLVVDPERFPDDAVESMAAKGMGAVYTRTSDGAPLRSQRFSAGERAKLMARYYEPHHQRLSDAVAAALAARDRCLLIDGHSFAATPYPHEPDQSPRRPDICIGTDDYHTPAWLPDLAVTLFRDQGFAVEVNRPFAGTLVPSGVYRRDARVWSVMIEVNRSLYMDERTAQKRAGFGEFACQMRATLDRLIGRASGM